ncbi:hypothetical protein [Thalassospira sp. TSL5-1]|uniref:hypothetical protein n=1 Tax=Thalassospira sp. TSL5-1 TaxID=1544451 RepID=UPI0011610194|nr:hypothetical protein [Thalassospira sp. TSL5-1]
MLWGNFTVLPVAAAPQAGSPPSKQSDHPAGDFCADSALSAHPCPVLPADIAQFDANFIYRFVGPESQRPFDRFSWQAFIAMTWPTTGAGRAVSYQAARTPVPEWMPRWQRLIPRDSFIHGEVSHPVVQKARLACAKGDMATFARLAGTPDAVGKIAKTTLPLVADDESLAIAAPNRLFLEGYHQATGDVLIDQAGNYVLYETRMNRVAADYIRANGLESFAGRARFAEGGKDISFPQRTGIADTGLIPAVKQAHGKQPIGPGATLVKMAWRILPKGQDATGKGPESTFLTRKARIFVAGQNSLSGHPLCLEEDVGLIGMHLVQRVVSGNGDRWIWSTFEHVANAPLAGNARRPNSFIAKNLFPDGCYLPGVTKGKPAFKRPVAAPVTDIAKPEQFNLFRPPSTAKPASLETSVVNQGVSSKALWGAEQPYAVNAWGDAIPRSQLVRCWKVFEGTEKTNEEWHAELKGSVWTNYFLVGTQWIGNGGGVPFGVGEVPRFLSNLTMESFIQDKAVGSCLGCHSTARSDAGQPANFTFMLAPTN